jgi:hypothetical protein
MKTYSSSALLFVGLLLVDYWGHLPIEMYNLSPSLVIRIVGDGVQTGSTRHVGHFWPIVPAPGDCEDGEFGGMNNGNGN